MAHLIGTPNNDTLTGEAENDLIEGLAGNDILTGGIGNDVLYGGSGSDRLYDSPGSDLAVLGPDGGAFCADVTDPLGRDVFRGNPAAGEEVVLFYDVATQHISINLMTGRASGAEIGVDRIENIASVSGGAGNDVFRGDDRPINGFIGGAGDDAAIGNGGFDRLDGYAGNDSLNGGDGDDWLLGYDGADYLVGGAGDDWINFTIGPTDTGPDVAKGGDGNDWICGSTGDDKLLGGDGDDFIEGGQGADLLLGGAGADIFALHDRNGNSIQTVIGDFQDGTDKLRLRDSSPDGFAAHAHDTSAGLVVDYGLGSVLLIKGFKLAQLDAMDFF